MHSSRSGRRLERGSAVVEFALVLPVLLLLCLALVQVGVLARDQLLLVQAARAGSRQAVVDPVPFGRPRSRPRQGSIRRGWRSRWIEQAASASRSR